MCSREVRRRIVVKTLIWLYENNISAKELEYIIKNIEASDSLELVDFTTN